MPKKREARDSPPMMIAAEVIDFELPEILLIIVFILLNIVWLS